MDLGETCHFNWRTERRQTVENDGCYKSTEDDITCSMNKESALKDSWTQG